MAPEATITKPKQHLEMLGNGHSAHTRVGKTENRKQSKAKHENKAKKMKYESRRS